MKDEFVGYYILSEDEFGGLWNNARIVVDANVLLATYGLSPSTRNELMRLLESFRERLWIPHQFALEYQRNRLGKILEQVRYYEDALKILKNTLESQFRSKTRHPFVSEDVERGLELICDALEAGKSEQEALLTSDSHFIRITELFERRVGTPYNESELDQMYETARRRYSKKIPPGFKDIEKPEPDRYADYLGWRQILDFAAKQNTSVILVTDDSKEDWWRKEGDRNFGPHPLLVVEFRACSSNSFYMYSSDRFLKLSERYLGGAVDPNAIDELKKRRESLTPPMKPTTALVVESFEIKSTGPSYISESPKEGEKPEIDVPKAPGESLENQEGD